MQSNKKERNPRREKRFSICCWYFTVVVVVAVMETFTEREEFRLVVAEGAGWRK